MKGICANHGTKYKKAATRDIKKTVNYLYRDNFNWLNVVINILCFGRLLSDFLIINSTLHDLYQVSKHVFMTRHFLGLLLYLRSNSRWIWEYEAFWLQNLHFANEKKGKKHVLLYKGYKKNKVQRFPAGHDCYCRLRQTFFTERDWQIWWIPDPVFPTSVKSSEYRDNVL